VPLTEIRREDWSMNWDQCWLGICRWTRQHWDLFRGRSMRCRTNRSVFF